ncbi:unnamed protein product, partial [marine sediment metagenome]
EANRTEEHPDRDTPEVPKNIHAVLRQVYGNVDGRDLTVVMQRR